MNISGKMPRTGKPGFFYGWYIVAASWLPLFFTSAIAVAIFFKPILEEFHLDRATLSSVQTAALIILAAATPLLGRLIDRFGSRAMLLVSVTAQTLSSVVNGLATSLWHLYIGRFLLEIRPVHSSQVLVNRWFVRKRGIALGIAATSMPVGMLVMSPISQYLIDTWGWRETLLFWAVVTFVVLVPLVLFVKDKPEDKGYGADGEPLHRASPVSPPDRLSTDAPPTKSTSGNSLSQAIRTGAFWLLSGTQLFCGIGCGFMMTHIVIFTTDVGYSAMIGATLLSVLGAANLVGVLVTGHMSDQTARNRVLALAHLIRCISFVTVVIFILLGSGSLWLLYVAGALFGFGFYTTAPLSSGLAADLFGNLRLGTIIGIMMSYHLVGMAIGAYSGGATFELTGSYYLVFLIQGILEFLAAVFAFAIKPPTAH